MNIYQSAVEALMVPPSRFVLVWGSIEVLEELASRGHPPLYLHFVGDPHAANDIHPAIPTLTPRFARGVPYKFAIGVVDGVHNQRDELLDIVKSVARAVFLCPPGVNSPFPSASLENWDYEGVFWTTCKIGRFPTCARTSLRTAFGEMPEEDKKGKGPVQLSFF